MNKTGLLIRGIVLVLFAFAAQTIKAQDPLPSWNDGPTKKAIIEFVKTTTEKGSPNFVPPAERIATFDQDGTLWVEKPMPVQGIYCLSRVPAVCDQKPELKTVEPFKTILSGDREAISKLSIQDFEKVAGATLSGMTTDEFSSQVSDWLARAKDTRWQRPYTELVYQPMIELLKYLRSKEYKTYIVTGGGQDFVRVYSERVYGIPPEQIIGTMGGTSYSYDKDGKPILTKQPKIMLMDDKGGKPQGIYMMIGRVPYLASGNSTGDKEMLEYTKAGSGARFAFLVIHDDASREFEYSPAQGMPADKEAEAVKSLTDEAKAQGWYLISMKNDWKVIFPFELKK